MYVLRYKTDSQSRGTWPQPNYLYKTVGRNRRYGWLEWSLTTNIKEARQWATEDGVKGYVTRLPEGDFTVEFIDDSAEKAAEARAKALLNAERNLSYALDRYGRGDLTIVAVREALTVLDAAVAAVEGALA